ADKAPAYQMTAPGFYHEALDDFLAQSSERMPRRTGPALRFSKTGARVEVPPLDMDFTQPFTVEVWATPDSNFPPVNHPFVRAAVAFGDATLQIEPHRNL